MLLARPARRPKLQRVSNPMGSRNLNRDGELKTLASYAQRSMWSFALRYRGASLNEITIPYRVRGPLLVEAMEDALTDLIERHPTLRAVLHYEKGQLFQVVLPAQRITLPLAPVEGSTAEERLEAVRAALTSNDRPAVNVISGPSTLARLWRLGEDDHALCLQVHHAMCDGWSTGVMMRELMLMYEARVDGSRAELPPLVQQYADVAQWEIETYESGGFAEEIEYWQGELADPPPAIALPTKGVRKGNRDWRAHLEHVERPSHEHQALRDLSRRLRVSPFSLFLSALAVLLRHRTGSEDQLIGVPTLNRWSEEAMKFVGYATSLMPVRLRPHGGLGFDELCHRVQASTRMMLACGRVPLEVLMRETPLVPSGNTVFRIWCQYIDGSAAGAPLSARGLQFIPVSTDRHSMLSELDLDLFGSDDGLRCEFSYRPCLFEAQDVRAMMSDFLLILQSAQAHPSLTVDELARRLN